MRAMPGTIETDGRGAPARPDWTPSGGSHTKGARRSLNDRWLRFGSARSRATLAGAATIVVWAASALTWALQCLRIDRTDGTLGWDLIASWRAEVVFAHGGQPYSTAATDNRLFLYPPSALLVDRPIAWMSLHQVAVFGLVATALLMWATIMISAAVLGRRWWGLTAGVVVLAVGFAPAMTDELKLTNVTVVCALALALFYLLTVKGHWVTAGVAIGLTLSVKPLLLPVLLVFVLARRWRALAVTVAIPAVLNAAAFLVVKDPGAVFSKLPSLLDRSGSGIFFNSAWVDVMRSFAVPDDVTILVRLVTIVLGLLAAWWSWRRLEDPVLRVITTSSILLIGTYLAGTLSESHFMLTLVPLAMTVVVRASPMRWVTAWIGVLVFMGLTPPGSFLHLNTDANFSAFRAFGMTLVLLTVLGVLASRRPLDTALAP
jgi:arabinofuranan 3-O-arabinosyltransferase